MPVKASQGLLPKVELFVPQHTVSAFTQERVGLFVMQPLSYIPLCSLHKDTICLSLAVGGLSVALGQMGERLI